MRKLGLVLMGRAMLSKSVIQFSVDGWGCVPSLLFDLRPTYGGRMKMMVTSFKRSHARTAAHSDPNLAAGHHRPTPPPETPGHSWACPWGHKELDMTERLTLSFLAFMG